MITKSFEWEFKNQIFFLFFTYTATKTYRLHLLWNWQTQHRHRIRINEYRSCNELAHITGFYFTEKILTSIQDQGRIQYRGEKLFSGGLFREHLFSIYIFLSAVCMIPVSSVTDLATFPHSLPIPKRLHELDLAV